MMFCVRKLTFKFWIDGMLEDDRIELDCISTESSDLWIEVLAGCSSRWDDSIVVNLTCGIDLCRPAFSKV